MTSLWENGPAGGKNGWADKNRLVRPRLAHEHARQDTVGPHPSGAACAFGAGDCRHRTARGTGSESGRTTHLGGAHLAGAHLVRPGGDAGDDHALPADVRAARRHGEADARQRRRAVPGGSLEDGARRAQLRVHPARRHEVPQRRAGDRRRREVLLRALSRHLGGADEGAGGGGRDAGRSAARSISPIRFAASWRRKRRRRRG